MMLLQFSAENYCSIKDRCILSLCPSVDTEHKENIYMKGGYSALNMLAIYGSNASGKSNVQHALTKSIVMVRTSNMIQAGEMLSYEPFRLDDESIFKPSCFEYILVADNFKKYVYGFSYVEDRITSEYLYCYNSSRPSLIFEREGESYRFPQKLKKTLDKIAKMNMCNKLLLSTATAWNTECTAPVFRWFAEGIDTYTNDASILSSSFDIYLTNPVKYIEFTKQLLKSADINISDIQIEEQQPVPMPMNRLGFFPVPGQLIGKSPHNGKPLSYSIIANHEVMLSKEEKKTYQLGLDNESLGTQQLFFCAPFIKNALDDGRVIVIDEMDRSLHPLIVRFIVNLFRSKKTNPHGAQLIFTTHTTSLLTLTLFRRDQIWMTEKHPKTGITNLYSLNNIKDNKIFVRKDDSIEKNYLKGRYGAIPFLQDEDL